MRVVKTAWVHNSCDSGISVLNHCHSWDKWRWHSLIPVTLDSSVTLLGIINVRFPKTVLCCSIQTEVIVQSEYFSRLPFYSWNIGCSRPNERWPIAGHRWTPGIDILPWIRTAVRRMFARCQDLDHCTKVVPQSEHPQLHTNTHEC